MYNDDLKFIIARNSGCIANSVTVSALGFAKRLYNGVYNVLGKPVLAL